MGTLGPLFRFANEQGFKPDLQDSLRYLAAATSAEGGNLIIF
jgi:hypothetical protein